MEVRYLAHPQLILHLCLLPNAFMRGSLPSSQFPDQATHRPICLGHPTSPSITRTPTVVKPATRVRKGANRLRCDAMRCSLP